MLEALRERDNPNFVPKPRPVIARGLTPLEEFKCDYAPHYAEQLPDTRWYNETNWLVTDCLFDM